MAVAAAGDVQPRGVLGRVAAAVAPGELGGGLRVVLDQVLEDGDADLLDARGLDDLFFCCGKVERKTREREREEKKKGEDSFCFPPRPLLLPPNPLRCLPSPFLSPKKTAAAAAKSTAPSRTSRRR